MKYLSEDGKVFTDECECMEYERKLRDKDAKKREAIQNLRELRSEFIAAKDKYDSAVAEYKEKYESTPVEDVEEIDVVDLLDFIFMGRM